MKYLSFLTCAVIFFICLNGCAGSHTNFVSSVKAAKRKLTYAQTLTAELAELARQPIRTTVEGRQEVAQMGSGNSIIQTMYDAFGNKTESRVFENDSFLKMIVLKTSASGQQEALVYGQNGEVKVAPQSLLGKVLTSVAGEIAKTVQIFEVRKEDELLAKLDAPVTPTEDILMTNLNQPVVAETAPVAETEPAKESVATETAAVEPAKIETKTVKAEDSAAQLRAAVQSLKAVRKTPANPATTNNLIAKTN